MSLPTAFENHLKNKGVSAKTLRNYRSDLNHFLRWAQLHSDDIIPHFSGSLVANYKGYHLENKIPESTTNRRLSTIRGFAKFLVAEGHLAQNPTEVISNIKKDLSFEEKMEGVLEDFKRHLEKEGVSKTTLKNYISDTRQFLAWLDGDPGQESSLKA